MTTNSHAPSHLISRGLPPSVTLREVGLRDGLQAIQRTQGGWFGGADPRKEGVAKGD